MTVRNLIKVAKYLTAQYDLDSEDLDSDLKYITDEELFDFERPSPRYTGPKDEPRLPRLHRSSKPPRRPAPGETEEDYDLYRYFERPLSLDDLERLKKKYHG